MHENHPENHDDAPAETELDNQRQPTLVHNHGADGLLVASSDSVRVEERLRAQREFFRNIVEGAADVATLIAPDGTILYASAAIAEATSLGYSPQEVVGRNCLEIIHPDDRQGVVQAIADDLAGVPTTVEARTLKRDRTWMWTEMRGRAIVGLDGKTVVIAYSRNIDDRKHFQQQLEKSEEYFKSLLHGSSDLIGVIDLSGTIRFTSDSVQRILGYRPDEVLGMQVFSFIHEDDVPRAMERLAKAAESSDQITQLRVRRKDGSWSLCEGSGGAVTSPEGEPLLLINARDIGERSRIEREHALLAAIVESSDDAIVSNSLDQRITTWNKGAERMFGFTAQEAIGQRASIYMPPEWKAWGERFLDDLKTSLDHVQSFEVPCMRKDGRRIDAWTVCGAIRDRDGNLVGISAIHRDLTERKRADREQALLAALVNSSEDAIISHSTDFRITSWNRGAHRLLGYTAEEAAGKRPFDLYIPLADRAADQARLTEDLRRIRENPEAMRQFELPVLRKDGTLFDATLVGCGIHDSNGALIGLSTIIRDVTARKRAEREQALLAAVVTSSEDAIISLSTDFRVTSWNRGAQKLLGYAAEEALGKRPFDFFVPSADNLTARTKLTQDLAVLTQDSQGVRPFEARLLRNDGSVRDVTIVASGILDPNGKLVGLSTIMHDITQRKRAEREQAQLATIVNASSDAIVGFSKDLVITSWNRTAERTYGYSAEEAIGRGFDLFVSPDQLPQALEADRRLFETGVPVTFEEVSHRRDGSSFTSLVNIFPIRDPDGNVVSAAGIARDITQRKRAERETAMFAAIVNASQDAIINVSLQAQITTWNPAAEKTYGYTAEEAIGKGLDLFVPPEELQETAARTLRVIDTAEPVSWEQHPRRKDGTPVVSAVNIFPICDAAGRVTSVAGIGRDITALKETERQLIEAREAALAASQAKSEFLSSMSHEIRTPMTAILGMAELLAEGQLDTEQRRYIEILCNNGNALLDLINSILDLAKVESGRLTLEHVAFELFDVVEKAAQTLAIRAHAKRLELIVSIAPDVPTALLGDPLRLRQVLINLIGNAIKFTERGEVLVSVERDCAPSDPLSLKFSVRDTGIGIAQDKLSALFTAFTQADSSTARKYGGSGLGLVIVKRLVSLMNGEVTMQSELGKGSTFSFTSLFEVQPDPPPGAPWPDLAHVPILIVDANSTGRAALSRMLAARGATVIEAASYLDGLAAISRAASAGRPPRIVLLDDRIATGDPRAPAQLIAAASQCGAPIVAMIYCDNLAADISRLRTLKLDTYLIKPIDLNDLARVLRHVIVGETGESPPDPRHVASRAAAKPPIVDRPLKILFADDSPDNRTLVRALLKKTPYHLDEVENGRQAIDSFIAGDYDLVLMDIQMPEVDGYAATRAIRDFERDHNRSHTPIVALTASVFSEAVRLTREAGCDAHVGKPVSKATLLRAIYDAARSTTQSHI